MSLNLGNSHIKDIYLGATNIKEAYLGSVKVYGKSPIYKDRYEYTLFENQYGGSRSGTVSDAFSNYDLIGIRLSNDPNTTEPRKTRGANWIWYQESFKDDNGKYFIYYRYYDGTNYCNLLCQFNYDNLNRTFSVSVPDNDIGWNLYTKANDNSRMYGAFNEADLSIVSKIIGVKYQWAIIRRYYTVAILEYQHVP